MIKWILLSFGTMILVITIGVAVMLSLKSPEASTADAASAADSSDTASTADASENPVADSTSADSLLTEEELNQKTIQELTKKLAIQSHLADSLQQLIAMSEERINKQKADLEKQAEAIDALKETNTDIQDLAKTFQNMKVAELRTILQKIDDDAALKIYANMNNRSRKKLLLGLSGQRAAILTEKIVGSVN